MFLEISMEAIATFFRFFFGVFGCVGTIFGPLYLIPAVLRDPHVRKRNHQRKVGFSLLDISCLFVLMALPMAFFRLLFDDGSSHQRGWAAMIVFALLGAGIWWTTIRKLSHANVRSNVQRFIVVLIVTPVVWVTSLFLPGFVCYTVVVVMTNIENANYGVTLVSSIAGIVVLVVARKYMLFIYANVPEAEVVDELRGETGRLRTGK